MRWAVLVLSLLLVLFPFARASDEPMSPASPAEPSELPEPALACPTYAGHHAYPAMTPLEKAPAQGALSLDGSFAVSAAGSATHTLPLIVPPGRIEPALSITYDSSADIGLLGKGFSLRGLSMIHRCSTNLAQDGAIRGVRLDVADHVCLDGLRLVQVGQGKDTIGDFAEYRTFPDTQTKIHGYGAPSKDGFDSIYFVVFRRDGHVVEYGKSNATRVVWRHGITRAWSIERDRDRFGNTIRYYYATDANAQSGATRERVPDRITYAGHVGANGVETQGSREVRFRYTVNDGGAMFHEGERISRDKQLAGVDMFADGVKVRSYEFDYDQDPITDRSLLVKAEECAAGDLAQCKPAARFGWSDGGAQGGFETSTLWPHVPTKNEDPQYSWTLADVTGDGLPDIVTSTTHPETGRNRWFVYENVGGGNLGVPVEWADLSYPTGFLGQWLISPLDYNGDGRIDLLVDQPSGVGWNFHHVLVSRPEPSPHFELVATNIRRQAHFRASEFTSESASGWTLADLDADGMLDFVGCDDERTWYGGANYVEDNCLPGEDCKPSLAHWRAHLWRPGGFEEKERPIPALDGVSCWTMKRFFGAVDWDADGQTELVTVDTDAKWWVHRLDVPSLAWESRSTGLPMANALGVGVSEDPVAEMVAYPLTKVHAASMNAEWDALRVLFPDVNADGYPDLLHVGNLGTDIIPFVYENHGRDEFEFFGAVYAPFPAAGSEAFAYSPYARVFDSNRDGRDDLFLPVPGSCGDDTCYVVYESGKLGENATVTATSIQFENPYGDTVAPQYLLRTIDLDGDQDTDIVYPYHDAQMVAYRNRAPRDLLTTLTTGRNPKDPSDPGFLPDLEITYGDLVDRGEATYAPRSDPENDCIYPRACVVGGAAVVSSYRLNNGQNEARRFEVEYRDGRAHRHGRGFLGFGARIVRDLDTGTEVHERSDNVTFDSARRTFPFAGMVIESETRISAAREEVSSYYVEPEVIPTSGGATYFVTTRRTEKRREQDGDLLERTWTVVDDVDTFGNVLEMRSFTEGVDLLNKTTRTVTNDPALWLLGLVEKEKTCSSALGATQCRETEQAFDLRGALWRSTRAPNDPAARRVVHFLRDDFGNVTSVLADDAFGHHREACVTYEPSGTYPWATRNAAGHTSYHVFDAGLGVELSMRDPNALVTKWRVEGFGRVVEEHRPDGVVSTRSLTRAKDGGPFANEWALHVHEATPGHGARETVLDSLGRPVRQRSKGPDVLMSGISAFGVGKWIVAERSYDFHGRMVWESNPHIEGDAPAAGLGTTWEYDNAGRVISTKAPWGAISNHTYDHDQVVTQESNPEGGVLTKRTLLDAIGRPITVVDAKSGETTYTYEPFGLVRSVELPDGTSRETVHDDYGRRIEETDPDRGKTTSVFDGFDQVTDLGDALGRHYKFEHDALGRLTRREQGGEVSTYEFDMADHGVGFPSRVIGADGHRVEYKYDALSRPWSTTLRLADTRAFAAWRSYDTFGRLSKITYPGEGDFSVYHEYDTTGTLTAVRQGVTRDLLWQLDMVDGAGRTVMETFGNGALTERDVSPQSGAVESIFTHHGTNMLQGLVVRHNVRLNVDSREDKRQQKIERFQHDELDRLTCSRVEDCESPLSCLEWNGPCDTVIEYDAAGDITFKSDVGTYTYDPVHPHAVQLAGSAAFANDAVGNQITRPDVTITYTDFDLPRSYVPTAGGPATTFEYDGHGARVLGRRGERETIYFGDLFEQETRPEGVVDRYFVSNGERMVAVFERRGENETRRYVHVDHLGSVDVITDEAGAEVDRRSFDAFGAPRDPAWGGSAGATASTGMRRGFTWHEQDEEVGLVNAKGRIYDPRIGRFLQTDPIVADVLSGQAWNPYSYTFNNPLAYVDPSGYQAILLGPVVPPGPDGVIDVVVRGPPRMSKDPELQTGIVAAFRAHLPTPPPASSPDAAEPEASFLELPGVQYGGGVVSGAMIGTVPGGSIGAQIAIDAGALPQGTREARLGKAVGEMGAGIVQMVLGAGGSFLGGGMSTTGGGAIVGMPIAVASAGMLVNGYAAVGVGWDGFWQAWSTGGGASGARAPGPKVDRRLTQEDLGLGGTDAEVQGSIRVKDGRALVKIDYIGSMDGVGMKAARVFPSLKKMAREYGASSIRVETTPIIEITGNLKKLLERMGFAQRSNGTMFYEGGL
ncbi:FG-GAP-like repeat-containing protein [Polyangium sorediatum]|uniref:FG-GAP-like repeat-containing protein n=1 Tax=Polyangium sorediatum TaxID=889274 RepID=A0ABT6NYW2_9BACT|nr:FG-GAP-like repeat-containing protein [Polyangium sorediatum]MDI1433322.1 FG-GAP-like repeat-containing protein [Polyangium sorediatum]